MKVVFVRILSMFLALAHLVALSSCAEAPSDGTSPASSIAVGAGIIGGSPILDGELQERFVTILFLPPYSDGLVTKDSDKGNDFDISTCSGVLLTDHWVLTAAHCVSSKSHEVWVSSHLTKGQPVKAEFIAPHPAFKGMFRQRIGEYWQPRIPFDYALIRIEHPLNDKGLMMPTIGSANGSSEKKYIVTGSGVRSIKDLAKQEQKGLLTEDLQNLSQKQLFDQILNKTKPQQISLTRDPRILIPNNLVLRQSPQNAACVGDSGGPVWQKTSSGWALVGIVSHLVRNLKQQGAAYFAVNPAVHRCFESVAIARTDAVLEWMIETINNQMKTND